MAEAAESLYTLGRWLVKPGQEDAFVAAWQELSSVFLGLAQPPGVGTLLQSTEEPRLFYSFGPWPSLQAIEAMRLDPSSTAAIRTLMDLCETAEPGTFRLAATAGQPLGVVR